MGDHGGCAQLSGSLPNGLLSEVTAKLTRVLDADRWLKVEGQTAELIARIQPNQPSEEHRNAVANYVQRLILKCFSCRAISSGYLVLLHLAKIGQIGEEHLAETDDGLHNATSEVLANNPNIFRINNPSVVSCAQSQIYYRKQINSRLTNQHETSNSLSGSVQTDKSQKLLNSNCSVNDQEELSRFQFARTRYSPELTEVSIDSSQGRHQRVIETEKIQFPAKIDSDNRRKNLRSEFIDNQSSKCSLDACISVRQTLCRKNLEVASYANVVLKSYHGDVGFTAMEELASVSEKLEMQSNVDNLESFNDDSAVTELNSENNGHGNPNEDDVVLSEGSNFGDGGPQIHLDGKNKNWMVEQNNKLGREGRRLTKENYNDPFQAKTSSGSDLQSNFRSSNTRFSTLSWASSSRSKPASEYLRDQSAAKFPRTFVATGPPVPFLMLPFGDFTSNSGNPDGYAKQIYREEEPGVFQDYADEAPRYRGGTGTDLPNSLTESEMDCVAYANRKKKVFLLEIIDNQVQETMKGTVTITMMILRIEVGLAQNRELLVVGMGATA
ncbi:Nucleotidyltransferase domain [Musa troglodytarum]|uniref:Nucleotidyltransferase domain n=1 Tax=Musa troglodytarum TaxID=320322 RepID=A0A9E7FH90_9LILI|nr:Nucleotidyltransferase domain [Musa troglodytarum]